MTRHIVLGNGKLLVNIDKWLQLRDLYYPHVGQENHVLGHAHRMGVYADNSLSWINEDSWQRDVKYKKMTLVSDCRAVNEQKKIELKINDCVNCGQNIFLKKIILKNNADNDRTILVMFHHDFHLYGDGIGDTAGYDPTKNAVFHYKRSRYFLINALKGENISEEKGSEKNSKSKQKGDIYEYSVGTADMDTFGDAYDGKLSLNPIAQGSVDSIISLKFDVRKNSEKVFYYWIACGLNFDEVDKLNKLIIETNPKRFFTETDMCWTGFANQCMDIDFKDLGEDAIDLFKRSLLVIRTQTDEDGGILAANDSDSQQFNKDTYSYVWPRDGALVSIALQRAGYYELSEKFYLFCREILSNFGCFLHKYNPDKSLGSSWHPWIKEGKFQLPLQEDETALVVIALWDYYSRTEENDFVKEMYPLIKRMADFLADFVDEKTNLPEESYDLWEEHLGVHAFTCSTVCRAMLCASKFAQMFRDKDEKKYLELHEKIHKAVEKQLYDPELKRFLKTINFKDGKVIKDTTLDSSMYGLFYFCGFDANDERIVNTMNAISRELSVKTNIGGFARYQFDNFHKVTDNFREVPGNPWFISTIWMAEWHVLKAKNLSDLDEAKKLINWVVRHALSTGILSEQIHPYTGEPLSVSPLTWSHAAFVNLIEDYLEKYNEMQKPQEPKANSKNDSKKRNNNKRK